MNAVDTTTQAHRPALHRQKGPDGRPMLTSSSEWIDYYDENARRQSPIPWFYGSEISEEELSTIARSLQAWQLGETSDGAHLRRAAASYAKVTGDRKFIEVADLFIKEEQRHGEMLGKYLDLAGAGRIKKDWGDTLFRAVRYASASMEVWATPVIMVETMALIYYRAIHDATGSRVLRAICRQILHDEIAHIRFQYERLAILHRGRSIPLRIITMLGQRALFSAICIAVWIAHRCVFKAGGHTFRSYWRAAWRKMGHAWSCMHPGRYSRQFPLRQDKLKTTRTLVKNLVKVQQ